MEQRETYKAFVENQKATIHQQYITTTGNTSNPPWAQPSPFAPSQSAPYQPSVFPPSNVPSVVNPVSFFFEKPGALQAAMMEASAQRVALLKALDGVLECIKDGLSVLRDEEQTEEWSKKALLNVLYEAARRASDHGVDPKKYLQITTDSLVHDL